MAIQPEIPYFDEIIKLTFYYDVKKRDGAVDLYDMFRLN